MARLVGPTSGPQLAYQIRTDNALSTAGTLTATVYSDAGGTVLADILTIAGAPIPGSVLTVGSDSTLPLFQYPDGVDTVYVSVNGGPLVAVYARGTVATGTMAFRGAWAASTAYAQNDVVTFADTMFVAPVGFTSGASFNLANWTPLNQPAHLFNVRHYGAKGDGKIVTDGAITSGTAILTSATANWTAADVGKPIMVKGAAVSGQTTLVTTILSRQSATQVTLAVNASTTVASGAWIMWGSDDTAAVQAAINAAYAYAVAHGSGVKVSVPAAPGVFYAIAGPLVTGGSTHGNAQLTIPVAPVAGSKVILDIEGSVNGTGLFHWQQTTPQFSGSTLLSFGNFANGTAQTNSINTNGQPCLIGGPDQPAGYGTNALLFSNMLVTLRNLELITTYSSSGFTYTAACFVGVAEANVFDCQIGVTATYLSDNLSNPNPLSGGLSIGLFMPANGNNDNSVIRNLSVQGGYTYALFATEHLVVNALRITYCWAALVVIGGYGGMVGASHAVYVDAFSCEGCIRHVYMLGNGQAGQGPTISLGQLDTEGIPIVYDGSNNGNGGFGLGDIPFTGFNAPSVPNPTGIKLRNLIQQPGFVAAPAFTSGTPFMNPFWRDATVTIAGATNVAVGKPTAGVACLGGSTAPTMQATGLTAGTFRVPAGGWITITGTPTANVWVLD